MFSAFSPARSGKGGKTAEAGEREPSIRYRPNIHVLATGGTIAGRQLSAGPRYRAGVMGIEALLDAVPALRALANISSEQVTNIGSQDMDEAVWLQLARRVNELHASGEVDGVVITHGTDTLEETACFLDLTVGSDKPTVLVGAMRPAGAFGADGPANLLDAVAVAARQDSALRGVLVVMHGSVFEACDVTKLSATSVQAFGAPNAGPLGQVLDGRVFYGRHAGRFVSRRQAVFDVSGLDSLPPVGIVYGYANASDLPVRALVEAGYRGIVSAGVGSGNLHHNVLCALANASDRGVAVVRASRSISGLTLRDVEVDDARYGFIVAGALNPQKARVLLQLALTRTQDPMEIQKAFDAYQGAAA